MKKHRLIVPLVILLLCLLIPVFHTKFSGINHSSKPVPNATTVINSDSGSGKAVPASNKAPGNKSKTAIVSGAKTTSSSTSAVGPAVVNNSASEDSGSNPLAAHKAVIGMAVVGKDGQILFGPADVSFKPGNNFNALTALKETGISYAMSTQFPDMVVSIAGLQNKGQSGWMYKVNDQVPMQAAADKDLQPGDHVVWWYSESLNAPSPDWNSLVKQK